VRQTVTRTDTLVKHQKKAQMLEEKLATITQKAKPREHRRLRWNIAREKVLVSRIVRELKYTNQERKRLLDKVNKTVEAIAHAGAADSLARRESMSSRAAKS